MITIVAKRIVKADKINEFQAVAAQLVAASQKEAGCISYNLYQEINNPQILTFIETWQDLAAIESHSNSSHFTTLVPQMAEFLQENTLTELYTMV